MEVLKNQLTRLKSENKVLEESLALKNRLVHIMVDPLSSTRNSGTLQEITVTA